MSSYNRQAGGAVLTTMMLFSPLEVNIIFETIILDYKVLLWLLKLTGHF